MFEKLTINDLARAVSQRDDMASLENINTISAVVEAALKIIGLNCLATGDQTVVDLGNGHDLLVSLTPEKL